MVEKSHTAGTLPTLFEPFRGLGRKVSDWLAPASDASTTESGYKISLELPGVEEKDIDVSVQDGLITVKGEKTIEKEDKGETWYFSERQYGAFSRSFRLPADAVGDQVEAHLKDGVLMISVPKKSAKAAEGIKIKVERK